MSIMSSSSSSSLKGSSSTLVASSSGFSAPVVYFSLDKVGIAEVGELRPDPAGVLPVRGVIPAGVKGWTEDRRRVSVIEGLREMEEFLRLEAADPERDRGGVSANAKMDRSNSIEEVSG
jgi:hypothetical protein